MKFPFIAAAAAVFSLAQSAQAHEFKIGDIVVDHPMVFETAPMAKSGGGYLTIINTGTEDDRLIAVQADFPKVDLHESATKDGVATMSHVNGLSIPAGQTVALKPGGYHIMFMGLDKDGFDAGTEVPAVLVFEKAGELPVIFNVEKRDDAQPMGHGGHDQSN